MTVFLAIQFLKVQIIFITNQSILDSVFLNNFINSRSSNSMFLRNIARSFSNFKEGKYMLLYFFTYSRSTINSTSLTYYLQCSFSTLLNNIITLKLSEGSQHTKHSFPSWSGCIKCITNRYKINFFLFELPN